MELLIYCPQQSSRTVYIFDFIFKDILLLDYMLTNDKKSFQTSDKPKISYCEQAVGNEIHFKAVGLLAENKIYEQDIDYNLFGDDKVPFSVTNSTLPFDIFAASFYFVSRYEEYLPYKPDIHFRFPPQKSLQYQLGLLKRPIVDEWAMVLKNILVKAFPQLKFGKREFKLIPTIDIDRAYLFKSHGLLRNTARFVKAVLTNDRERIAKIIKTGLDKQKDPFNVYSYLDQIHRQYNLTPIFFFLLSKNGNKDYDVNIYPDDELLKKLIKSISENAAVGIHPSYASNGNRLHINAEKNRLATITKQAVTQSRQHFLKLHLPKTYIELINESIHDDYTMGYASELGFRAGTCTPFYWYDLQLEKTSHLRVHSFPLMDATLRRYLKLAPHATLPLIDELIRTVKTVSGTFYSLWHNESLSETAEWKGWRFVYEHLLKEANE